MQDAAPKGRDSLRTMDMGKHTSTPQDGAWNRPPEDWTRERNDRRVALIDKFIQGELTPEESVELEQLTEYMRTHFDTEAAVPLEGAKRLHRRLLQRIEAQREPR
jgi:hypothetical protein